MKKKQSITSPNKITIKQSANLAKYLGPQQVIMSDTSIKNYQPREDINLNQWQRSSKSPQQKYMPNQNQPAWKPSNALNTANPAEINKVRSTISNPNQIVINPINQATQNSNFIGKQDFNEIGNGELVEKQHNFPNGDQYIGTWNGKHIEGYGVYTFTKLNLQYRGQFKMSKQHGAGILARIPTGSQVKLEEIYDGEWMNGQKHGLGKYYYFREDTFYDGNWARNKKFGHGTFKSPEGEYVGEWRDDKKFGKGILRMKNGHIYQGIWEQDQFLQGTLSHSNGDKYDGEFKNFQRNGYGTYFYSNKTIYRGHWQDNLKTQSGEIKYFNGDVYQGPMNADKRQGKDGQYSWKSGEQILGQFQNDLPIRGKIRLPAEGESQFNLIK